LRKTRGEVLFLERAKKRRMEEIFLLKSLIKVKREEKRGYVYIERLVNE
jgi:hypothetical protein